MGDDGDKSATGTLTMSRMSWWRGYVPPASCTRKEASLSNMDDTNGRRRRREMNHPMMMKRGVMSENDGLMPS